MKFITDECFLGCDADHIRYVTRKFERRLIRKFKYCKGIACIYVCFQYQT